MTGNWRGLTAGQKRLAESVFDALCTLDDVQSPEAEGENAPRRFGFSDLYTLADDPDCPMTDEMRLALEADETLSEGMRHLLAKTAAYRLPPCAAASSGSVLEREGVGFSVRLHPSRAETSQYYVIIEVAEALLCGPRTLFVCEGRGGFLKFPLPEWQGGSIQVLAEAESDLVRALRSPGSEVFLR